tara:strand:- start:850 stop:1101 length:252 start_codon:yes stop_codon:yes gene_type:complete
MGTKREKKRKRLAASDGEQTIFSREFFRETFFSYQQFPVVDEEDDSNLEVATPTRTRKRGKKGYERKVISVDPFGSGYFLLFS